MATIREGESGFVQIIRGVPFPKSERFLEKNILEAMDYVPQEGDIVIASFPKTGTTWLQYIVLQIISRAQQFPGMEEASQNVVPFLEQVGVSVLDSLPQPRLYKHHISYDLVQKSSKSKYIYIYRNPEDTLVSYYNFMKSVRDGKPLDFEQFFDRFLSGDIEFGSYFQHVLSFYNHRNDSNLLLVSYEDLHANTRSEVLRIAKFIGEEHHSFLRENGEILDKILENTSFDSMKRKLQLSVQKESKVSEHEQEAEKKVDFFRKGIVGDGKNVLTSTQRERIKQTIEEKLKDTEIGREWLRN